MGVESFFVNFKVMSNHYSKELVVIELLANNFCVEDYSYDFRKKLIKKQIIANNLIVDNIVYVEFREEIISLQACYTCIDKSIKTISNIIRCLNKKNPIDYVFYCNKKVFAESYDNLESLLHQILEDKYKYFLSLYPIFADNQIDMLPHNFYKKSKEYSAQKRKKS